jgi:hypothetical protein
VLALALATELALVLDFDGISTVHGRPVARLERQGPLLRLHNPPPRSARRAAGILKSISTSYHLQADLEPRRQHNNFSGVVPKN